MKFLIFMIIIFVGVAIHKNRHWFIYMWKEYIEDDFPNDVPEICFKCNKSNCKGCEYLE